MAGKISLGVIGKGPLLAAGRELSPLVTVACVAAKRKEGKRFFYGMCFRSEDLPVVWGLVSERLGWGWELALALPFMEGAVVTLESLSCSGGLGELFVFSDGRVISFVGHFLSWKGGRVCLPSAGRLPGVFVVCRRDTGTHGLWAGDLEGRR